MLRHKVLIDGSLRARFLPTQKVEIKVAPMLNSALTSADYFP
jgi:hypothetical protein